MMKKQLLIFGSISILICVGLSACTTQNSNENQEYNTLSPEKNRFVGTWKNTSSHLTLDVLSDGTCSMWGNTGTWNVTDGKLVVDLISAGVPFTYTYIYIFFYDDIVKLIPTKSTTGSGYVLEKQ